MIEAHLSLFVNWEQNNCVRLLLMAEFADKNAKNASTGHTLFKLNCNYHSKVLLKENVNPHSKFCFVNKLSEELKELIEICYQNLFYA